MTMAGIPDEKTPEAALARIVLAIMALPPDADPSVTFGRRSASVGGGWYWAVSHVVYVGSGKQSRYAPDRHVQIKKAIEQWSEELADIRAVMEESTT